MIESGVFLVIAIVSVGLLVLVAIILRGNHSHHFNKEEYQTRWLRIENSLRQNNPSSYATSVIEADKLLDRAMRELGIPGKSMGERLKRMNSRFSEINHVWGAHKIRNLIAHEDDYHLDYRTAARALAAFKQALKELGAI